MPKGIYKRAKGFVPKSAFKKGCIPWNKGKCQSREWIEKRVQKMRGKNNPNWKGGRKINHYGYILIHKPEHPYHNYDNYVFEHRLIMEQYLGRYLTKEERLHHINGITTDNRIENLILFSNNSEHFKCFHRFLKRHPKTKKFI